MKLIIIEGGDNLGKSLLIEGLCKHFNYDNVNVRHFGKPPKGLTPEEFTDYQVTAFEQEAELVGQTRSMDNSGQKYYDSVIIWNRSHLGEYVYSQMFREGNVEELKAMIAYFEAYTLGVNAYKEIYLVTLTADTHFFLSKEDGNSFSQNFEQKKTELNLFNEVHRLSNIYHKHFIKVDYDGQFRDKDEILKEVIDFVTLDRYRHV
jgi:thymidylate kinase